MGLLLRGAGISMLNNQIHDNGGEVGSYRSYRSIGVTVSYADEVAFTGNEVYGHDGCAFYVLETEFFDGHTYENNAVHHNDCSMKFQVTPLEQIGRAHV